MAHGWRGRTGFQPLGSRRLETWGAAPGWDGAPPLALAPTSEGRARVERLFLIEVSTFDWNCPKYITPRCSTAEVKAAVAPLKQRIAELEAQLKSRN